MTFCVVRVCVLCAFFFSRYFHFPFIFCHHCFFLLLRRFILYLVGLVLFFFFTVKPVQNYLWSTRLVFIFVCSEDRPQTRAKRALHLNEDSFFNNFYLFFCVSPNIYHHFFSFSFMDMEIYLNDWMLEMVYQSAFPGRVRLSHQNHVYETEISFTADRRQYDLCRYGCRFILRRCLVCISAQEYNFRLFLVERGVINILRFVFIFCSSSGSSKDEFIGRENANDLFGTLQILQFEILPSSERPQYNGNATSSSSETGCTQSTSSARYTQSETMTMHTATFTANSVFGKHDSFYRWFSQSESHLFSFSKGVYCLQLQFFDKFRKYAVGTI